MTSIPEEVPFGNGLGCPASPVGVLGRSEEVFGNLTVGFCGMVKCVGVLTVGGKLSDNATAG